MNFPLAYQKILNRIDQIDPIKHGQIQADTSENALGSTWSLN